ncbi:MAG: hypothetical protein Q8R39_02490 [bacterium]|nr:hypothetical protein [bacterium]MDZ4284916.1 hypothetical protein [Patescibacteria group bacterium]
MKDISIYIQKYVHLPHPELRLKEAAKKAAEHILGTDVPIENIRVKNGTVQLTLSSVARAELFLHKQEFDFLFQSEMKNH